MGEQLKALIDIDKLEPETRKKVIGMYNSGTLNRFLTLALNHWLRELAEGNKSKEVVGNIPNNFDFNLILNVLLDIRENTLNIDEKCSRVQTQNITQDMVKQLSGILGVGTQNKENSEIKNNNVISFSTENIDVETVKVASNSGSISSDKLLKLRKLKGGK